MGEAFPYQQQSIAACVYAFSLLLRPLNQISKCSVFFCSPAEQQENGFFVIAHKLRGWHCAVVCATVDNWWLNWILLQKHDRIETNKACQPKTKVGLYVKLWCRINKSHSAFERLAQFSRTVTWSLQVMTGGMLYVIHKSQETISVSVHLLSLGNCIYTPLQLDLVSLYRPI